jgi:hypothetical protein
MLAISEENEEEDMLQKVKGTEKREKKFLVIKLGLRRTLF